MDSIEYVITEDLAADYSRAAAQILYDFSYSRRRHIIWSIGLSQLIIVVLISLNQSIGNEESVLLGYVFWSVVGGLLAYKYLPAKQIRRARKEISAQLSSRIGQSRRIEIRDTSLAMVGRSIAATLEKGAVTSIIQRDGYVLLADGKTLVGAIPSELLTENTIRKIEQIFGVACQESDDASSGPGNTSPT